MTKKRLNKVLASSGIASRRNCDTLIFDGRVTVNGAVVDLPQTQVDPQIDVIRVNGKKIFFERKIYYLLHKPTGVICSSSRVFPRSKIIRDLFAHNRERLFTVGRLDKESSGLIIVTNDGDFANRIAHPSYQVHKEYLVKAAQEITANHLKIISEGTICQGQHVKPIKVIKKGQHVKPIKVIKKGQHVKPIKVIKIRRGTLKITVGEGKKHEVRTLVAAAGLKLLTLCRIRIGPITLGELPVGSFRELSYEEVDYFLS